METPEFRIKQLQREIRPELHNVLHRPKRKMRILNSQYNCTITGLVVFDTI